MYFFILHICFYIYNFFRTENSHFIFVLLLLFRAYILYLSFDFFLVIQIRLRDDDDEKIKNIEELARKALSSSSGSSGSARKQIIINNERMPSQMDNKKIARKAQVGRKSNSYINPDDEDDNDDFSNLE